jgi:hypothetical protein
MIDARIKKIDLTRRAVTVTTHDQQEITLTFPEGANIEVTEPATMGTMGGTLEDLREGYFVQVEFGPHDHEGTCSCVSLVCVS